MEAVGGTAIAETIPMSDKNRTARIATLEEMSERLNNLLSYSLASNL